MAEASSLSRRNTARLCSTATSISGWPGTRGGQWRPPLQVCLHTGQIFSTRRAYPPARRAVKVDILQATYSARPRSLLREIHRLALHHATEARLQGVGRDQVHLPA